MTLYLWHFSVLIVCIGIAYQLGAVGLQNLPGSGSWWWMRLVWIPVLLLLVTPVVMMLMRFESVSRASGAKSAPTYQAVIGTIIASGGLTFLALGGVTAENWIGFRVWIVGAVVIGAYLAIRPLRMARPAE